MTMMTVGGLRVSRQPAAFSCFAPRMFFLSWGRGEGGSVALEGWGTEVVKRTILGESNPLV